MMKVKMKKSNTKKIISEIPDEIRIMYGKFYIFSLLYIIFFGLLYPLFFVKIISFWSSIIVFLSLIIMYIYMIIDVFKRKKTFNSNLFFYLIFLVFLVISLSIGRFLFFLEI